MTRNYDLCILLFPESPTFWATQNVKYDLRNTRYVYGFVMINITLATIPCQPRWDSLQIITPMRGGKLETVTKLQMIESSHRYIQPEINPHSGDLVS